ncbi:MAG: TIR domain-containing protein [Rhodanobacter sp.]
MSDAPESHYRAFISYSHQDKAWADWLHKALETWRVPPRLIGTTTTVGVIPRSLSPIFRDRDELASAHDLGRKVNEALAQSANLIVICSPRAVGSRWVNEEVLAFKRLGRRERIFCLIVDGEPWASDQPGRASEECFVPALRFQLGAEGRLTLRRAEPIAADARPNGDGRTNARLKLIAGMLGVGFDVLKQREVQRRHRRQAAITLLAMVVMLVTSVLAIEAMFARHAAVVAAQAAERRQKQAEDLVNFMLGDLNEKLGQVQRLDIMEAVDDHAMTYFQSLPASDITDQALAQRVKALEKIGSIRQQQGHLSAALASYEIAAALAGALARAAPHDASRQIAWSRELAYIGTAHWYQGKLDAAQQSFEAAQVALLGAGKQAVDPGVRFQLSVIDNNIGHVLEARGQLEQAALQYDQMLLLMEQLTRSQPGNDEWAVQLGAAHNNLGKLALMRGDLAAAVAQYGDDDAIESRLAAKDPANNQQRESLLTVRAILGRTQALAGDSAAGLQNLQQAVAIAAALVKVDPHNSTFEEEFARYATQLARLKRLHGEAAQAVVLVTQALATLDRLSRQDPTDTGLRRELAEAQTECAAGLLAANHPAAALDRVQSALHSLQPLRLAQPHDRNLLLATTGAQLLLAELEPDQRAATLVREAVVTAAQGEQSGQEDPRLRAVQVEALLGLQRTGEAQPLIRQLWRSGYRDGQLLAVLHRRHIPYPVNPPAQQQRRAGGRQT